MHESMHLYGGVDQEPDDRKLGELIVYFARESQADDDFGAIKLNKLLYFADANHYLRYGKSITGQAYKHLQRGPAPDRFLQVQRDLKTAGAVTQAVRTRYGREQKPTVALRDPLLSVFSAEELDSAVASLQMLSGKNGREVSNLTHDLPAWKYTQEGQLIPYTMLILEDRKPTAAEVSYGLEVEARLNQSNAVPF